MGKYSDALRKIEEDRLKGKVPSLNLPAQPKPGHNKWKGYAIGASAFVAIVLLSVYAYGVRKGMNTAETLPLEAPILEVPLPPVAEPGPADSVGQLAEPKKDELLLSSLEGMMKLSYEENQSARSEGEPTPAPAPQNFYTIQLVSFQNVDSARKEAKKLMGQGYQALVLRSSKYYSVCVDKFENAAQAAERLTQIKDDFGGEVYQDAFVRFVRQKQVAEE